MRDESSKEIFSSRVSERNSQTAHELVRGVVMSRVVLMTADRDSGIALDHGMLVSLLHIVNVREGKKDKPAECSWSWASDSTSVAKVAVPKHSVEPTKLSANGAQLMNEFDDKERATQTVFDLEDEAVSLSRQN